MSGFPGAHSGRVALVTGGATGLGSAFARRLARDGAQVVVADIADCSATVAAIVAAQGQAIAVECDVTSPDSVASLRSATYERFGRCDILVNNAGLHPNAKWDQIDFESWRKIFSVNLDSMFLTCKAFVPGMKENRFGRIVNISSNMVDLVVPGFVHYIASKSGVIGFTRALATELGNDGVTVNSVLPGLTRTPSQEAQWKGIPIFEKVAATQAITRTGVPADLEGIVSFLATEDAGWITAQSIAVDGGQARH